MYYVIQKLSCCIISGYLFTHYKYRARSPTPPAYTFFFFFPPHCKQWTPIISLLGDLTITAEMPLNYRCVIKNLGKSISCRSHKARTILSQSHNLYSDISFLIRRLADLILRVYYDSMLDRKILRWNV